MRLFTKECSNRQVKVKICRVVRDLVYAADHQPVRQVHRNLMELRPQPVADLRTSHRVEFLRVLVMTNFFLHRYTLER
jgi:hypothetical protein